jgi:hypothetical protein
MTKRLDPWKAEESMTKLTTFTALAALLLACAGAQTHIAKKYLNADVTTGARADIKLAMGPVSAPHLPSGNANGPTNPPSSSCESAPESCPTPPRKIKHPRKNT